MRLFRWGDKWEERFDSRGKGERNGETWRVSSTGERWSRTWGEDHIANGAVRKFGRSTSGEVWDSTSVQSEPLYSWEQPQAWADVLVGAQQLMGIEAPPRDLESESD